MTAFSFYAFMDVFDHVATRYPSYIAVESGGEQYPYQQVQQLSLQYATSFQQQGLHKGDIVAVVMPKSANTIIALLALWRCGVVLLPLDGDLPIARLAWIVEDAKVKAILIDGHVDTIPGVKQINFTLACVADFVPVSCCPDDLAYIIYTSGSTGRPKGVCVAHRGLVSVLQQQITAFDLRPQSRCLWMLSQGFDASISDIGTVLLVGATCVIAPSCATKAHNLLATMARLRIESVDLPPSILPYLKPTDKPACLRTIIIGGEVCPAQTVRHWAALVRLIVVYGPTEATICTSWVQATTAWQEASIGVPLRGVQYHIQPEGELWIESLHLAQGYLHLPLLTANKFIEREGRRYYRSGDRVSPRADGQLIFLGRTDRQIKQRGRLIELDEVEAQLCAHPEVIDAAVVLRELNGYPQLVAAITSLSDVSEADVKLTLSQTLPQWMIPVRIQRMAVLPRHINGKMNRQAVINAIAFDCHDRPPIENILSQFFGCAVAGDDDVFELGLDSLAIIELSVFSEKMGYCLSPTLIASARTANKMFAALHSIVETNFQSASVLQQRALALWDGIVKSTVTTKQTEKADKTVLLTGATGFLGAELLRKMVMDQDIAQLICLVRCNDVTVGWQRLLEGQSPLSSEHIKKIRLLQGDISQDHLGLGQQTWQECADTIDEIVHCAAEINQIKTATELYAVNVLGTRNILALLCRGKFKKLHYMSTLSVFVSTDCKLSTINEDSDIRTFKQVYGGYAQTKYLADVLVDLARNYHSFINIIRLGLITGDSHTGRTPRKNLFNHFIEGTIKTACQPDVVDPRIAVDITPVDYAASAIMHIIKQAVEMGLWHIANTEALSMQQLYHHIEQQGYAIPVVSHAHWIQQMLSTSRNDEAVNTTYLAACRAISEEHYQQWRTMDLFQATGFHFDCSKVQSMLKTGKPPRITGELIGLYIQDAMGVAQ